jgi:WD40 repeat protein
MLKKYIALAFALCAAVVFAQNSPEVAVFPQLGHSVWVNSAAFSPDGKFVLSGSGDGILKLWDAETGREIRTFAGHSGSVESAAFSPDGKFVISGSSASTLNLWDAETGLEIRTFAGHSD